MKKVHRLSYSKEYIQVNGNAHILIKDKDIVRTVLRNTEVLRELLRNNESK